MESILLHPLTQEQFDAWWPGMVADYARQNVIAGRWAESDALQRSREDNEKLLPQGLATPDHHFWTIARVSDREPVGILWFQVMQAPTRHAFVYNIEIYPRFRRLGYATLAMAQLEVEARRLGVGSIRLHVFAHNTAARPLYEKLGFVATNIMMSKALA